MPDVNPYDIGAIFKNHIKIEPQVWAIESLFNNKRRFERTNYKPSYQRNYVWNDEKASYFIESILLGTEIPPLIFFSSEDDREIIDGRQRYETIYRFVTNQFKLKKAGLLKFKDLANKSFNDLKELKEIIWETKIRIIEFSFHSKPTADYDIEDKVKKEIFKRYNTGITPLKSTEIDKAVYIDDDLNTYIKKVLAEDSILHDFIVALFSIDSDNIEVVLKKIRQLLVQHKIPISYYATEKQEIINKFYELLTDTLEEENEDQVKEVFNGFVSKLNYLSYVKLQLGKSGTPEKNSRLILECLFWGLSVIENEGIKFDAVDSDKFREKLTEYVLRNLSHFKTDRSSFNSQIYERYNTTAKFFETEFGLNLENYVRNNEEFKKLNRGISKSKTDSDVLSKFESLRLNKPDAVSYSIEDISRQMIKQRFLIRPIYQRNEVINQTKSSAIIESIILGIKLPPIFIFKRDDGVSEVIDGQQRLLSIIGFMGKDYLDENKNIAKSEKNEFKLNLKNGILKNLDKEKFKTLDKNIQDKIADYNLWIIEISQKNNLDFDPVDLYIRLNNKPYPIKENTFEMWNSYISRDIIETIKSIHKRYKEWFYLRKNNSRMEDESIYTTLIYLQLSVKGSGIGTPVLYNNLGIFKIGDKISFRVKAKNDITRVLEDPNQKLEVIRACNELEFGFIKKLRSLLTDNETPINVSTLNNNLDFIFNIQNRKRTQQGFYALWYFLYEIPQHIISHERVSLRNDLRNLFVQMTVVDSKEMFDAKVATFRSKYNGEKFEDTSEVFSPKLEKAAILGEIAVITNAAPVVGYSSSNDKVFRIKKARFSNYVLKDIDVDSDYAEDKSISKEYHEIKFDILVKKQGILSDRLTTAYLEKRLAANTDMICIGINRPGFQSKYVHAVVSSPIGYYLYKINQTDQEIDMKPVSISGLKEITIPFVTLLQQTLFARLMDYITFLGERNTDLLFFERLKDAAVYELFFEDLMGRFGCKVIHHLGNLPELTDNEDRNRQLIEGQYKELASPKSEVNASLLKLLSVPQIALIEARI